MDATGSEAEPLRLAIVGSGPAGFYTAEHVQRQRDLTVHIDMFDRLPTPFGLVRFGVAPDHQKIKNVTRVFDRVASRPRFRFFGNVNVGRDVSIEELRRHYHQIVFATGAQSDRRMGIPGEDLKGSHPATEFVAWYNGHPDYCGHEFALSAERVAVVGVGNVAVDVARILCRTIEELERTDIADYALDALRKSRVKEVYMLGRRGPAQAAFTNAEVRELGELPGADISVLPQEAELDPLSRAALESEGDASAVKKVEILREFAERRPTGRPRRLTLRFLVSPAELIGNEADEVSAMRIVKNALYESEDGNLRPRATDEHETLPVDLVFRSVGYHGVPISGLPFDDRSGVVPNERGRVVESGGTPLVGTYVAGWIKRGPSGVIGTNKADAAETVEALLEDLRSGRTNRAVGSPDGVEQLLRERGCDVVSYVDWRRIDEIESRRGEATGRPRVKLTSVEEMLSCLGRG